MISTALLRPIIALCFAVMLIGAAARADETRPPDLTLTGALAGADNQTYLTLPFQVPPGVERITVDFAYTGKEVRTTIDLGLFDPRGFRGWSGGNKARFTVSETDATLSYLPGAILPGEWRLLLGVPNIRATSQSSYVARIWFERRGEPAAFPSPPLRPAARWYRGDFHVHSGHSDGTCKSRLGATVPCPVFRVLEEAAARKLDFIALTDHNTISHFEDIARLAPWFDDLLIIPGREITTFQGHANLFGFAAFADFRLGSADVPDLDALLDRLDLASLIAINHPTLPSGELCMGCGWTAKTDWARVGAIEVLNGGAIVAAGGKADTPLAAIRYWEDLLNRGYRLTAIAGSDSHDTDRPAGKPGAIGRPTTVVYAEGLSEQAVLDGVRRGKVYIDVEGTGATLTFRLTGKRGAWDLGDSACLGRGERVRIGASGSAPDAVVEIVASSGLKVERLGPTSFAFKANGDRGWLRANVRAADGRLLVVGNPVYLRCLF